MSEIKNHIKQFLGDRKKVGVGEIRETLQGLSFADTYLVLVSMSKDNEIKLIKEIIEFPCGEFVTCVYAENIIC